MNIYNKIKEKHFDLLWVLIPPNSFARIGGKYKRKHKNSMVVFDLIDLWPETMPINKFKKTIPFLAWKQLRDKYFNEADYIVTECNLYKNFIPKAFLEKTSTIYLARKVINYSTETQFENNTISLCYLGSINNIIDIDAISKIIHNLSKFIAVNLHIIGEGENKDILIEKCKESGATVYYHGKIYDKDVVHGIMKQCHYGLNIMKDAVVIGLTMKSVDYFEHCLPIINNIKGDLWEMVNENEIGFNIDKNFEFDLLLNYNASIRERTKQFYIKNFSVNTFEQKIDKVLESIQNEKI